jgi:hypothetical protein
MDIGAAIFSFCILIGIVFLVSVLRTGFDNMIAQAKNALYS